MGIGKASQIPTSGSAFCREHSRMNMDCTASFYCIVVVLLSLVSFCTSDDRLIPSKPLSPGRTLVSNGSAFALGFFSPTNSSSSLYVGIWYNNIPRRTVVWVANRDRPITDASSASLAVTNRSSLVVSDVNGGVLWTSANVPGDAGPATAVLLNSGNLALQSPNGTVLWQSFDYPTDILLSGQKLRVSHKTGAAMRLVSWRSPSDPSTGEFSFGLDSSHYLQLLMLRGSSPYWRSGVWNGMVVSGTFLSSSSVYYWTIVDTEDEIYITFDISSGSASTRCMMQPSGNFQIQSWKSDSAEWTVLFSRPAYYDCDRYGYCGPYGYCEAKEAAPRCKCLDGFEPKSSNFSDGCRRKEELQCGGGRDGFLTLPNIWKLPDKFVLVRNRSLEECAAECSSNCSCTAYAYANLSSGGVRSGDASRCLVWMGELVDTAKRADAGGENLYLRLAGARGRKSFVIKVIVPILASVLILFGIYIAFGCKLQAKRKNKKKHKRLVIGDLIASNDHGEADEIGFPFISFEDIIIATDNFSTTNMLGQGGFGKVYKGILDGGNEVAVKRLSKCSGQGAEEFRNEIVLIAKLQHRNLVRLLGCCIQGEEKLLVYEYLPNKSLDAFLFDVARKSVLNWPIRFKIIKGVAKALRYLHQDSRLTIVHRDLKASNILLDAEMSPKISDFGLARIFGGNEQQVNTNRVVGTYGYMSPEYAMEGVFSVKSDVYSFGVLLLEIVSGLRISSQHLIMDFPNLIVYAWSLWKEGKASDLVDTSITESCTTNDYVRCIHIGLLCVQDNPSARPLMSSVVFMLENESTPLPTPKQPLYCFQRSQNLQKYDHINSVNNVTLTVVEGR